MQEVMRSCIWGHGSHRWADLEELKSFYFSPQLTFHSCGSHKNHLKCWFNYNSVLILPKNLHYYKHANAEPHTQKWILYQDVVQHRCKRVYYLYVWTCDREMWDVFKHNYSCLNICLGSLKAEKSHSLPLFLFFFHCGEPCALPV